MRTRRQTHKRRPKTRKRKQNGGQQKPIITYKPNIRVADQTLTVAETAAPPRIERLPTNHTIILIDHDSVTPNYVHWISTDPNIPYQGPAPPPRSAPIHNYVFYSIPITKLPPLNGRIATYLPSPNYEVARFKVNTPSP